MPFIAIMIILKMDLWSVKSDKLKLYFITIPVCLAICGIMFLIGTCSHTYFNEIWNYKIISIHYYQAWDEEVSCRHPKYKTVIRRDSKGNTYTEQVFDGYKHLYDVDYHPEHWVAHDEYNNDHEISRQDYQEWKRKWKNEVFVDMHRSYHSIDGDMFECDWPRTFDMIYPWSHVDSYQNKVRVSKSVFNFEPVSKEIEEKYQRPADNGDYSVIHGYNVSIPNTYQWKFRLLNANLGPNYKVHNIVLIFDASKYQQSEIQTVRNAWKGPNKNELVTCIGIDGSQKVIWCQVFSWMDDTTIHSLIRQDVLSMSKLDYDRLLSSLDVHIRTKWHKKSFKDFDYISINLPTGFKVADFILCAITCIVSYFVIDSKV
jgi:hypothetical protein